MNAVFSLLFRLYVFKLISMSNARLLQGKERRDDFQKKRSLHIQRKKKQKMLLGRGLNTRSISISGKSNLIFRINKTCWSHVFYTTEMTYHA